MIDFDENVPSLLKREQVWFGSIISRPIDEDSKMNPISPSGQSMEVEAASHIAPSAAMRPSQRIQIYNQQYWWRLLNTLHESFPLLTRLFGYFDFNRVIGIPYLTKYPPHHWSLSLLGDRLVQWLEEEYKAIDKDLVINAAKIDLNFGDSFIAEGLPPLAKEFLSDSDVFSKPLYLQPSIYLFKMPYNLFKFRKDFLQEDPDYWLHNEFPIMDKSQTFHFVLFRTSGNDIAWKEISEGEYSLLKVFQKGSSINDACDWLENLGCSDNQNSSEALSSCVVEEIMQNIQKWFEEWSMRGFLSLEKYPA